MPMIWMPDEELCALQAIFKHEARVNWEAYDRAKQYILHPQTELPLELSKAAESISPPLI